MNKLVIVESPSKAKTVVKYLGKGFKVLASVGHIRDLPTKHLGVDVEGGFEEVYEIPASKTKVVQELRSAVKDASEIILATDPDREGEAISWHLVEAIHPPKHIPIHRVLFHEITPAGIEKAMAHPTVINRKLVDAQRARRVLDRLVGYQVSQVLWGKIRRGLSAGRVQSVAVRLVVDREREIQAFQPVEYWMLRGLFWDQQPPEFWMRLTRLGGHPLQSGNKSTRRRVANALEATQLKDWLGQATYKVTGLETKERKRNPPPPYTTAKMQQDANQKLRMGVSRVMQLAQRLYEGQDLGDGPVGLITYMRTDSPRLSPEALSMAREYIQGRFGSDYLPEKARHYKGRSSAQEAHEAIRPTDVKRTPESLKGKLDKDQWRLYNLIWHRFVACQMEAVRLDETLVETVTRLPNGDEAMFEAKGEIERFPGWLALYRADKEDAAPADAPEEEEETVGLPLLSLGDALELRRLESTQHFTIPPPRYSEATLVKELEEDGIGRPSTYATIISTIQEREYVEKEEGRFKPTELGFVVTDYLLKGFQELMDTNYTARLEGQLDQIEDGALSFRRAMEDFYSGFSKALEGSKAIPGPKDSGEDTGILCEKCGRGTMWKKWGRFGYFLACSNYPACKNTREPEEKAKAQTPEGDAKPPECPQCGGTTVLKKGRFGPFFACTNYPDCNGIVKLKAGAIVVPDQPTGEKCPTCGKAFVKRMGRFGEFVCCVDYPKCKTVKKEILGVPCPKCGGDLSPRKSKFGKVFYGCTHYPKCDFTSWDKPVPKACPSCGAPYMTEKQRKPRGKDPIQILLCPACKYEEPLG